MKVLAKCSKELMPKMFTFPRSKSISKIMNEEIDSFIFSSLGLSLLESCYNFSETAKAKKINNEFSSAFHLVNCISVISYFNRILFFMIQEGIIKPIDVKSLSVTSSYRNHSLNDSIGGSRTSLHLYGLALDLFSNDTSVISRIAKRIGYMISNYKPIHGYLFPYELISYSPNRIHIGFKWYELAQ